MAAAVSNGWLSQLQAQSWYPSVDAIFAQYAPDVPVEAWEGELYDEDSSLSPTAEDYLNSGHYGLFQENATFPTSVGLPAASTSELESPTYNAYVAALAMEQAYKKYTPTTWEGLIESFQAAGWPGFSSASDAQMNDLQQRFDDIASIFTQENNQPPASLTTALPTSSTSSADSGPFAGIQNAISGLTSSLQSAVGTIGTDLLVGGVIVALIAGGFALMSSSLGVKAPSAVPVPV